MVIDYIKELIALDDNWNGNGAKAFTPLHLSRMMKLTKKLPYKPKVFPTAIGAIQLEYEKENGKYLEINIFPEKTVIFGINKEDDEYSFDVVHNEEGSKMIAQQVQRFYDEG